MKKLIFAVVTVSIMVALYRTNKTLKAENNILKQQLDDAKLRGDTLYLNKDGFPIGGNPQASIIIQDLTK